MPTAQDVVQNAFIKAAHGLEQLRDQLSMGDVADVLDIGISAAKMRVARAREFLRIELDGRI